MQVLRKLGTQYPRTLSVPLFQALNLTMYAGHGRWPT